MEGRMMSVLDAEKSNVREGGPSFSLKHRIFRAAWMLTWALAGNWTPVPLYAWRRVLLNAFGAKLAPKARIYPKTTIWYPPNLEMEDHSVVGPGVILYNMGPMKIGAYAIISQRAHLCGGTHDVDDANFQLKPMPITIGPKAWVAAEAFVGPGVTIGEGAVLGARGVAAKDLEPWGIYAGNPARKLRERKRF
jgi:putative colanic acid biosynthesis acetyltransferase WcaF